MGEQCDDGAANSDTVPDACRTNCQLPFCGDNVVDTGEECDSGGVSGTGCTATCFIGECDTDAECDDGDDICTGTETCDTANHLCIPGIPLNCDDGDPCTLDFCDPGGGGQSGCVNNPLPDSEIREGPDNICTTADDNLQIGAACSDGAMGDLVCDALDNCVATFNPAQIDSDYDGLGDRCDAQPCPGQQILFTTGQELYIADTLSGGSKVLLPMLPPTADVEVSPDLAFIYLAVQEPGAGRVTRIETATGVVTDFLIGLSLPTGLAVDFASQQLYVSDSGAGELHKLDLAGGQSSLLASGLSDPRGVDLDAGGTTLYVAEFGTGNLLTVDTTSGTVTTVASALVDPHGVAVNGAGTFAYVTQQGTPTGDLIKVDLGTGLPAVVAGGLIAPRDVEIDAAETIAWVATDDGPVQIDLANGTPSAPGPVTATYGVAFGPGPPVTLSVPDILTSAPMGGTVVVPVNLSDVTGLGVLSADFVIQYNVAVLTPLAVDPGSVLPGGGACTVTSNFPAASQFIAVSVFCNSDLTGAGSLVEISFDLMGAPSQGSPLNFASGQLNEGDPGVCLVDGSLSVATDTAGTIRYYDQSAGNRFVGAALSLVADPLGSPVVVDTAVSDCNDGTYSFTGIAPGQQYAVIPAKLADFDAAIDPFDAALTAQHVVGLIVLTYPQQLAADVTGNGTISSFDAAHIAQFSVGTITQFPVASISGTGDWAFIPAPISTDPGVFPVLPVPSLSTPGAYLYAPILQSLVDQNFDALLFGDVSGNWTPPACVPFTGGGTDSIGSAVLESPQATDAQAAAPAAGSGRLELPEVTAATGEVIQVPLTASGLDPALSFLLDLRFNPRVLRLISVQQGSVANGFAVVPNYETRGRARIALYSTTPLGADGELLVATFEVIGQPGSRSWIRFDGQNANEGRLSLTTQDGLVRVETKRGPVM